MPTIVGARSRYPIGHELYFGCPRGNDLRIEGDSKVSRWHGRFCVWDGLVFIEDFGRAQGTIVNGELMYRKALSPGAEIIFGDTVLTFHAPVVRVNHTDGTSWEAARPPGFTAVYAPLSVLLGFSGSVLVLTGADCAPMRWAFPAKIQDVGLESVDGLLRIGFINGNT